jgi:hypothetical protein
MTTIATAAQTILALHLGKYKSIAWCGSFRAASRARLPQSSQVTANPFSPSFCQ